MPKPSNYQPVATKEERRPLHGSRGKKSEWLHPELDTIPRPASRVTTPWIWLVHALLLSTSVTFFAVSLCMRDGGSLGHGLMSKISTYCGYPWTPFPRVETDDMFSAIVSGRQV